MKTFEKLNKVQSRTCKLCFKIIGSNKIGMGKELEEK